MTHRLPNRINGYMYLLVAVTLLGLIPARSLASSPPSRTPHGSGNTNPAVPRNCLTQDQMRGDQNPGVVHPPCSKPYGLTYGEWSAKWWQWVYSIPVGTNPQLQG